MFCVFIYVSQISIIESAKLEIAGALAFPGATITIDQVDAVDIIQQEAVLTAQLTNPFQIADANDGVIECIATIEGLPAAADPAPNTDLSGGVEAVPAMCGAPEPPVEEVQETASSITQLCTTLTEQPTAAELTSLVFIKQSLLTFKQTFISQISIFSQQLSAITGAVVTAASLGVPVISPTGDIGVATEIDISGGFAVGTEAFITYKIEVMCGTLNTILNVLPKLSAVPTLPTGTIDASIGANFAVLVSSFSAALSSGAITIDKLDIAQATLQTNITILPSAVILTLIQSAKPPIESLQ